MKCTGEKAECVGATTLRERRPEYLGLPRRDSGEEEGILLPRRQWRQARPPDETDSTTRKEPKEAKEPKGEPRAQPMEDIPIHARARRGRAEEAEGGAEAEGDEGDAESHYTMADSVCAGGTVERTRRTARPRTAGTACSSWSVCVPRDFSLEASKAPVLFHQKWCFLGCLLVLAWGETTNRTMADGREWYSCRTIRCGSGSWQDCTHWRGRTVEPAAGPRGTRCVKAVFL